MNLTQREYNILQIAFDCKDYFYSYRQNLLEEIMKQEDFNSNYDLVEAIYKMIDEAGNDLANFKQALTEVLEYGSDELLTGVLDLNFGRELVLVSRILYELENINWVPPKKLPPLPDFVKTF